MLQKIPTTKCQMVTFFGQGTFSTVGQDNIKVSTGLNQSINHSIKNTLLIAGEFDSLHLLYSRV